MSHLTSIEIINHLRKSATRGVGYYNEDNKNNEDNENNYSKQENRFLPSSSGIEANASLIDSSIDLVESPLDLAKGEGALPCVSGQVGAPTPLDMDQVERFIVQLFDNGESAYQRYKLKLKLNLTDKTNPEFIASLTKDLRNFKKYIPEPYRDEIIEMAIQERKRIKEQFGVLPYIGKFHFNTGSTPSRKKTCNQIEPDTLAIVWWDPVEKGWSGIFKIQNFAREFDLFTEYLTPKQKSMGVKAQDNWTNPKYDKKIRPKTWAQKRGLA